MSNRNRSNKTIIADLFDGQGRKLGDVVELDLTMTVEQMSPARRAAAEAYILDCLAHPEVFTNTEDPRQQLVYIDEVSDCDFDELNRYYERMLRGRLFGGVLTVKDFDPLKHPRYTITWPEPTAVRTKTATHFNPTRMHP